MHQLQDFKTSSWNFFIQSGWFDLVDVAYSDKWYWCLATKSTRFYKQLHILVERQLLKDMHQFHSQCDWIVAYFCDGNFLPSQARLLFVSTISSSNLISLLSNYKILGLTTKNQVGYKKHVLKLGWSFLIYAWLPWSCKIRA